MCTQTEAAAWGVSSSVVPTTSEAVFALLVKMPSLSNIIGLYFPLVTHLVLALGIGARRPSLEPILDICGHSCIRTQFHSD